MLRPDIDALKSFQEHFLPSVGVTADPVEWIEQNFGITLFSNQIENAESLFNPNISIFSILACRGAGKTWGLSAAIAAYCILFPGLRVIVVGPKEKQASRILREITSILKGKKCKVGHEVDWALASALRIPFKRGSSIIAISGQENANVEGEHGHILVIDEAHLVPTYSVTNKLTPMIGMLDFSKIVKIGVSLGRNHFYKTCMAPKAVVNKCKWDQAEIFLAERKPSFFYKKKQYSKSLLERMPLPYKQQVFPDRPDLQVITGQEISTLDWETQYELLWAEDILNFLSDEDQELLSDGTHVPLVKGTIGESYAAGLDTAQGSISGHLDTDETSLSIWRIGAGNIKEKVATFLWKGDPLQQMEEIWSIVNPVSGIFRCKMVLVDYSNIGIPIVEMFRQRKMNIVGKHFQMSEKDSRKNWKNAMYDHFQVQLQTGKVKYPGIKALEELKVTAKGEMLVQVQNNLRGFWEWCTLQRIRGRALNDKIGAPEDNVDGEGGSGRAFDDICTADIMGVWALDKMKSLEAELANGGDLSNYQIPLMVSGASVGAVAGMGGTTGRQMGGTNPVAQQAMERGISQNTKSNPAGGEEQESWMSGILKSGKKRR